jgi:GGDEF domain-containing protein
MGNSDSKMITPGGRGSHQGSVRKALSRIVHVPARQEGILQEADFHAILTLESRRAERSGNPFVVMLLDSHAVHKNGNGPSFIRRLLSAVSHATRETDIIGWYEEGEILAVIFTETNLGGKNSISEVLEILKFKIVAALRDNLDQNFASHVVVSMQVVPEGWDKDLPDPVADSKLSPNLPRNTRKKQASMVAMRAIDVVGSGI